MKTAINLKIGGLFFLDYLYQYKDTFLNNFITSQNPNNLNDQNDLIEIDAVILDKGHPEYKSQDIEVNL